jgi:hypothetical protein
MPACRAALLGLLCLLLAPCKSSKKTERAETLDDLYSLRMVPSFDLDLDENKLASLRDKPKKWVKGTFRYAGETYKKVSLRLKGHRSLRPIDEKPSLKVRFDKGDKHKGRRFLGVRRLTLNNLVEDPTMVHEYLSYRLARAIELPVPEAGFARLRINGEPYGLYLVVETPDEDFLQRYFGNGSGELYEGEYGCDLRPEDVPGFDQDSGPDNDRAALLRLATAAAGPADALWGREDSPLSRDHVAKFLAFSTYIGDFDGYHHSHNYRLYHRPDTGKWEMLSWGLDRAFVKRLPPYSSQGLLAVRCFADLPCRLDYLRWLRRIDEEARKLDLLKGARVLTSVLQKHIESDPKRPYDDDKMKSARGKLASFLKGRSADIAKFTACLGPQGEVDADGDGFGCMDCDDGDPAIHPGATEICDGVDNSCSGRVDDHPQCPCTSLDIDGQTFFACDLMMPWQEARDHCKGMGAELARIDSPEQARALFEKVVKIRDDRWWIGADDLNTEGEFHWQDGSPVEASLWYRHEPDNDACNQDCAALKDEAGGKLQDTNCSQWRAFVCRPAASTTTEP